MGRSDNSLLDLVVAAPQCKAGVVLTANGKTIVINQQTAEETQTLYNELLARCGQ